jgi:hypothetical protein
MDGYDLRVTLTQQIGLRTLLQAKGRALNIAAEACLSATLHDKRSRPRIPGESTRHGTP